MLSLFDIFIGLKTSVGCLFINTKSGYYELPWIIIHSQRIFISIIIAYLNYYFFLLNRAQIAVTEVMSMMVRLSALIPVGRLEKLLGTGWRKRLQPIRKVSLYGNGKLNKQNWLQQRMKQNCQNWKMRRKYSRDWFNSFRVNYLFSLTATNIFVMPSSHGCVGIAKIIIVIVLNFNLSKKKITRFLVKL